MSIESYLSEIIAFLGGMGAGSLLTIRFTRKSRDTIGGSSVNQNDITAGGDVVGGSKTTTRR